MQKIIVIAVVAIFLQGCFIVGDILFPNYCQVCEVKKYGSVIWSEEECGGGQDAMETRCKAQAYDEGRYGDATCECYFK